MDDYFEPAPFLWIEESNGNGNGNGQASTPRPRKKTKRKVEYVGWGSKELIEFLDSIGKDTTKPLSQHDVSNIVNQYVTENKLLHPNNKRRVLSDDKLFSIFNKKTFFRNKIHEFLEIHLAENRNQSEDDHFGSSDEDDGDASAASKKQKTLKLDKKILTKKKAPEVSKSCLVAFNSDNIKLVYLRKSLVQELLRYPETFESKVVGSYVRVKSDPHDIFQKNSHQLQLVTGVMEVAVAGGAGDTKSSKFLQISGIADNISIPELSDDNFSEEEIEDLRTRVKDGLLKQPTIGEFEQKVVLLHEDITKNWLARELKLLKNLIDRANEKGWRHRVNEYLDRRKLLESPAEQSRLLGAIPKVMPEEVKPVETFSDSEPDDSPKAADWDWEFCIDSFNEVAMRIPEVLCKQDSQAVEVCTRSNGEAHTFSPEERNQTGIDPFAAINNGHVPKVEPEETEAPKSEATRVENNGNAETLNVSHDNIPSSEISRERNGHLQLPSAKESEKAEVYVISSDDDDDDVEQKTPGGGGTQIPGPHTKSLGTPVGSGTQIPGPHHKLFGTPGGVGTQTPVFRSIFLGTPGGDGSHGTQIFGSRPSLLGTPGGGIQSLGNGIQIPESGIQNPAGGTQIPGPNPGQVEQPQNRGGNQIQAPHPELLVWHYYDPQRRIQGPFSLTSLKRWSDLRYFPPDFTVWMSGQKPHQAVQLNQILQQMFPN